MFILTNNPSVVAHFSPEYKVDFRQCSYMELFVCVRGFVHDGHKLLSHPLSGSVKPNETPYKSVMLTSTSSNCIDFESLSIIEDCIITARKFEDKMLDLDDAVLNDFMLVDLTLIASAIESYKVHFS